VLQLDLIDLGIKPIIKHTFANYVVSITNQQIIAHLKYIIHECSTQVTNNYIYLWGQPGVGKTHLLQAVCEEAFLDNYNLRASYFSFKYLINNNLLEALDIADILDNLEQQDIICLDDINLIESKSLQTTLFDFFNRIKDANKTLIIASLCSVNSLKIELLDLKSRLASGISYNLKALDDQDKKKLLKTRAYERGITLTDDLADYLITHGKRDIEGIFDMLNQLDRASMKQKRKLTIPFAKEILFKE